MPHLADRLPSMLSGGQQQRIALARALAPQPKIMLLDEPLSNLDALLRVELRAHLRAIHREVGFTGIYVTHDQLEAFNLGTRVAVMHSGKVEQLDTARNVYERPATEYVAKFLGIRNSIAVKLDGNWNTPAGPLEGDLAVLDGRKGPLQLYVRPQAVELSAPAAGTAGPGRIQLPDARVVDVLYAGAEADYVIDLAGITLYVSTPIAQATFAEGDPVGVTFASADCLVYAGGQLVSA